ncbi:bifunctional riboflavin kinase/FAD synthetase [Mucilaginibacter rubeus]|uniref:Riboflavin biosynthesis protein n=1 Tax=Mucilaginibacter rubeus TaxID=2027860 RepID=A0AAE6JLF0_9SPHI|nr:MULTISPECIES: bifunctional riboflavin kinase/FAD synthetase [Mucilaginibacter]QEM07501.1 bifunctional riboflavin kinase/FAD synthetase [Mucilaginibacter rubeus]QEM19955.1 bifunctional riboflavin kinase/FAD synthetase [Mucilaginibacter gossypii]QTE43337.1 bifunctional riboflavin kinase/FAD synthetase [Mucilaginibacter rubeus]QTE49937.1 bifunctional riboflavin kinase/FAD synthetase [Mucilaginibacter rubeus]QTE55028.1 bifunctional riboflavin kinase/FAD synthetase [Mucilaginibacter rubeus]
MRVYNNIDEFTAVNNAVVTIGTFDGVHLGHRKIISGIKELAESTGGETVILTFFPHPRMILHPEDESLKLITTIAEKADLMDRIGVDHLIITPFSRDFSNQSAESYIRDVLVNKIGTKKIVIGYDHRFGKDRQGGFEDLQRLSPVYGFDVVEIPEQDINEVAISSTRIRNALLSGDIHLANAFLGYPFFITGKVVRGDQIGRQLGYPTANIVVEEKYKLIPCDGIFAVTVIIADQKYKGMAYIGSRPTVNGLSRNIEVNIFDFNEEIYNQTIRMEFYHYIRGDVKFSSLDELKVQLAQDKVDVLKVMN